MFERYFAVSDADAPDPDFAKLSKTLAGDAVGSARVHLPAGQNCLDDAVDAVEGALVMSQTQLEARHVTGGCKGAKRREHAFQAHLSLSLHSLRSANSKSDKRRTKKAAKHLAKVVNPLSFLLHPVGIQALHAFVLGRARAEVRRVRSEVDGGASSQPGRGRRRRENRERRRFQRGFQRENRQNFRKGPESRSTPACSRPGWSPGGRPRAAAAARTSTAGNPGSPRRLGLLAARRAGCSRQARPGSPSRFVQDAESQDGCQVAQPVPQPRGARQARGADGAREVRRGAPKSAGRGGGGATREGEARVVSARTAATAAAGAAREAAHGSARVSAHAGRG